MKRNIMLNILISIAIGYISMQLQILLVTNFLTNFLSNNLITLLVTLIAINSATLSIVLTKIRELIDKNNLKVNFSATKKEMVLSINEQVILIAISIFFLMILDSEFLKNHQEYIIPINILVISCFVYGIRILYDTAKSIFVILDFKE